MQNGRSKTYSYLFYLLPASSNACFNSSSILASSSCASARRFDPSSWIFTTSLIDRMISAFTFRRVSTSTMVPVMVPLVVPSMFSPTDPFAEQNPRHSSSNLRIDQNQAHQRTLPPPTDLLRIKVLRHLRLLQAPCHFEKGLIRSMQ